MSAFRKVTMIEFAVMAFVIIVTIIGVALGFKDEALFSAYVEEDGVVEWLTVVALLAASAVCIRRAMLLRKTKHALFIAATAILAAVCIFGAGEEISWGQRLLGVESPEFFKEHSAQKEINLHNLVVGDVKLNKLIFSNLLGIVLGFYLLIWPLLYRRSEGIRRFNDALAVPVQRLYQVLAVVIIGVTISMIPSSKNPELLEFAVSSLFFLIVAYPVNRKTFR